MCPRPHLLHRQWRIWRSRLEDFSRLVAAVTSSLEMILHFFSITRNHLNSHQTIELVPLGDSRLEGVPILYIHGYLIETCRRQFLAL